MWLACGERVFASTFDPADFCAAESSENGCKEETTHMRSKQEKGEDSILGLAEVSPVTEWPGLEYARRDTISTWAFTREKFMATIYKSIV